MRLAKQDCRAAKGKKEQRTFGNKRVKLARNHTTCPRGERLARHGQLRTGQILPKDNAKAADRPLSDHACNIDL